MKLGNSNTSSYSRPKLSALRSYSSLRSPKSVVGSYNTSYYDKDAKNKKPRSRKQGSSTKMDYLKKRTPNYTDIAYREAVGRLRYLLNESYGGSKFGSVRTIEDSGEETDDRSLFGTDRYLPSRTYSSRFSTGFGTLRKYPSYSKENLNILKPPLNNQIHTNGDAVSQDSKLTTENIRAPPELMTFIDKQEEYIEQLERETQYCRDELANLLGKVKDVVSENEALHQKEKDGFIRSIFDNIRDSETEEDSNESDTKNDIQKITGVKKVHLEGPSIVFESRISELEAQLTQAKIDLKNAQEENNALKKKECLDCYHSDPACKEGYRKQIENLQRDKQALEANVNKLQASLSQLRDTESDSIMKTKRSQGLLEQMIFEKNQSDMEIRRLKDELEKQYDRVREANHETARRVAEERAAADKRYCAQVDQLGGDLSNQWETANKLQLELERQRRIESDYKREITSRNNQIDDLKMELRNKTVSWQSDLAQCNAEKQCLEEEIATLRLSLERADRNTKSEMSRLNSEITSLRQRLDRSDSDLLQARRENLRLSEQLANLQKEITLGSLTSDENPKKDLQLMIHDMENKHMSTVHELETLVQNQSKVMDKLTDECKSLTQKLDEASNKHKQEINNLQNNIEYLNSKIMSNEAYSTNNSQAILQHNNYRPESRESVMSHPAQQISSAQNVSQSPQPNIQRTSQQSVHESPQRNIHGSPQRNVQQSPQSDVHQSPLRRVQQSPQSEVQQSPTRRVQPSPQPNIQRSTQQIINQSPQRAINESPVQQSPQRRLQQSPQQTLQQSPQRSFQPTPQPLQETSGTKSTVPEVPKGNTPTNRSPEQDETKTAGNELELEQRQQDDNQYTGENVDYAGYEGYEGYDAGSAYQQYGGDQQYQPEQQYQHDQQYGNYDPNQQQYMQGEYEHGEYDNTANQQYNTGMQGQYDQQYTEGSQQPLYNTQAMEESATRDLSSIQHSSAENAQQRENQPTPTKQ